MKQRTTSKRIMSSAISCKCCGSSAVETDHARSATICTECGTILEDSAIVSEIQFEENAHGGSTAIGQFVPSDSKGASGTGIGPIFNGKFKESREMTIFKAKAGITGIGEQLRITQYCQDIALNFYKLALSLGMTRGRKSMHVCAAVLYIACRVERTPHLLIDFSDIIQTDVFTLGRSYVAIINALHINIPCTDPCLYVLRYASRLNFGEKTHAVSTTALRLLKRMKRDSLHFGRRPSGLCGAALYIASKFHKYDRKLSDIVNVVHVQHITLRKRLIEFGETPSSSLTMDEFMSVDLSEEQDPPSFKLACRKDAQKLEKISDDDYEKKMRCLEQKIITELEKMRRKGKSHVSDLEDTDDIVKNFNENTSNDVADGIVLKKRKRKNTELNETECLEQLDIATKAVTNVLLDTSVDTLLENNSEKSISTTDNCSTCSFSTNDIDGSDAKICDKESSGDHVENPKEDDQCKLYEPTLKYLGIKNKEPEQCDKHDDLIDKEVIESEFHFEDISDDDIDRYIISKPEYTTKIDRWNKQYEEYLKLQKERQEKKAEMEANKGKRKKRPRTKIGPAKTVTEAVENVLKSKKFSAKINYEILHDLNLEEFVKKMSTPTDKLEDGAQAHRTSAFNKTFSATTSKESTSKEGEKEAEIEDYFEDEEQVDENISAVELLGKQSNTDDIAAEVEDYDDDDYDDY